MFDRNSLTSRSILALVTLLVVGASLVGWSLIRLAADDEAPGSMGEFPEQPKSMAALTRNVELVVVGTVRQLVRQEHQGPPGTPGGNAPPFMRQPFAFYEIQVDELLVGEALRQGEVFLFRVNGAASEEFAFGGQTRMPVVGEQRLFLLVHAGDGVSWASEPWSSFSFGGGQPRFVDPNRTAAGYLVSTRDPSEFKKRVADAVRTARSRR